MKKIPDLSVLIITYNQEQYIQDALMSVINQKVNISIELIVVDDCSKDSTREKVEDYEKKHSQLIKVIRNPVNLGAASTALKVALNAARADIVCFLEGDDYYIKEDKLQMQYNYLKNNVECPACFTDNLVRYEDRPEEVYSFKEYVKINTLNLINGGIPHTSTLMFRKSRLPTPLPSNIYEVKNTDLFIMYLLSKYGPLHHLPGVASVYRVTGRGLYSGENDRQRYIMRAKTYEALYKISDNKYEKKALVKKIGGCKANAARLRDNASFREKMGDIAEILLHDLSYLDYAIVRYIRRN